MIISFAKEIQGLGLNDGFESLRKMREKIKGSYWKEVLFHLTDRGVSGCMK